jgi:hypothetical protein
MKNIRSYFGRGIKHLFVALVIMSISLLALRAVYAISLFDNLSDTMVNLNWSPVSTGSSGYWGHDDTLGPVIQINEELTYEASYLFFKLGSVKFRVLGKTVYDSVPAYRLRAEIDSYSGVPFVNLHAVYETIADARTLVCLFTANSQKDGKSWIYTKYNFDFKRKVVNWQQSEDGKLLKEVDYPLDRDYTDGVSFFYYIRDACRKADGKETSMSIPIVIDTIRSTIEITVNEKKESCDVTAYDFPLESYRMSGHLNFKGFFGVTGDFVGWMSADPGEIPLKADVKVILGSVVVKLKSVSRDDWVPPRSE